MKKLIFSLLICLIFANPLFAEISVINGLTHEMTLDPGSSYEGSIHVMNKSDEAVQVMISQTDYMFNADGQTFYSEPNSLPRSNAGWISLSPSRITIPGGETASVYYKVTVPQSPDLEGTYWSVMLVKPVTEVAPPSIREQDGKIVVGLNTVIQYAIQIITNIGETGESNIKLTSHRIVSEENKTLVQLDIENTGDRWLSPSVWTELYDEDGAFIGRFYSDRSRIFPSCSVRHLLDLTQVPNGHYTALMVVDNGDDRVFGASYEVRLEQ